MISMLILQTEHGRVLPRSGSTKKEPTPAQLTSSRGSGLDYFSLAKSNNPTSPITSTWARVASPKPLPLAPSVSSSNSSRGSWSSLFNSGTMRQFMSGVQDTLLLTPSENHPSEVPVTSPGPQNTISKSADRSVTRMPDSPRSGARRSRKSSILIPPAIISKSWHENTTNNSSRNWTPSLSTIGHKRHSLRFAELNGSVHEKHVVFDPPPFEEP